MIEFKRKHVINIIFNHVQFHPTIKIKYMRMKRILGMGNALVDVVTMIDNDKLLEKFNLPKGSMQLVNTERSEIIMSGTKQFKRTFTSGGSAANTIHGLAMLGTYTGFIGSVGRDETGDFFENEMKLAGVNTLLLRRNNPTGTAVALITPDSERTFATCLGAAVELNAEDLHPGLFRDYDILYLEGYLINNLALVESACRMAKENDLTIALDLASYNVVEAYRKEFSGIVNEYVDILFANESEAKAFTGLPPLKALESLTGIAEVIIFKMGADGSWIKSGKDIIKIAAEPVSCKDTTGAGDLYAAGFLYGFANNLNPEKCGSLGSLMAGKVIEITGARMDEKRFADIRDIISKITRE